MPAYHRRGSFMHTHEAALHLISVTGSVVGVVIARERAYLPTMRGPRRTTAFWLQSTSRSHTVTHSARALGPAASLTHSLTHSARSLASHSGLASVCLLACSSDELRDARRLATPRLPRRFPGRHGNRPFPPDRPRSLYYSAFTKSIFFPREVQDDVK